MNIFSNLLTYTDNLKWELYQYASMNVYTSYNKDRPINLKE